MAKSKIKRNPEMLMGEGMALAGLILGYVQIGFMVVIIPLIAAITIPSFMEAKKTAQVNACIYYMHGIDSAKEQWALAEGKMNGDEVDIRGVNEYIKDGATPICPAGGKYTYHRIGEDPERSLHGTRPDVIPARY